MTPCSGDNVECGMWSELTWFMWSDFVLKWS